MKRRMLLVVVFILCACPLSGYASHSNDRTIIFDNDCFYFSILDIDGNILLAGRESVDGIGHACARLIRPADGTELWHQHYDAADHTQIQRAFRLSQDTALFVVRYEDFSSAMWVVDLNTGEAVHNEPLPENFLWAFGAEENTFLAVCEGSGHTALLKKIDADGNVIQSVNYPHTNVDYYSGPYYALPQGGGYFLSKDLLYLDEGLQISWQTLFPDGIAASRVCVGNGGLFFGAYTFKNSPYGLFQVFSPEGQLIQEVVNHEIDMNDTYLRAYALPDGWGVIKEMNIGLHAEFYFASYDVDCNQVSELPLPSDIFLLYSNVICNGASSYLVAQEVNAITNSRNVLRIIEVGK